MLSSLYANKTFLNDKLTHKYTVVFDYKFFYSWSSMKKNKIIYDVKSVLPPSVKKIAL